MSYSLITFITAIQHPLVPKTIKTILISLLLLLNALQGYSTHLVGGSINYEYVATFGNSVRYKVTLVIYRDCSNPNGAPFDDPINLGVYEDTLSKKLYKTFQIPLSTITSVNPPQGANCKNSVTVCLQEGFYTGTIDIPITTHGYHLVFERCCRNTNQVNIPNNYGQSYYAFIPSASLKNSSPKFSGVPAPYICVNDSSTYLNSAIDPDGDSLSYTLVRPWAGGTSTAPNPSPSANLSLPLAEVGYNFGYSASKPFGNAGYAGIEITTGLTTMLAPQQGLYSMAIEVTEWRNGIAISSIRRDVQIIAINCAGNATPSIAPTSGGFSRSVEAGETICFDIRATDTDINPNQKVIISGRGEVFGDDPNWKGPIATFKKDSAASTITSQFCWTPSCDQGRVVPYTFVIDAIDDGCPPKSKSVSFNIEVKKFPGQISFGGKNIVCTGDTGLIYFSPFIANYKYKWEIVGGTIVGADTLSQIKVNWGSPGSGSLSLVQTNPKGCLSPKYIYAITIGSYPNEFNIDPDTVCEFSDSNFYEITPTTGSTYNWLIFGGALQTTPLSHQAFVHWDAEGSGKIGLIETNKYGCIGDTSWQQINITRPHTDSIYGSKSVCPHIRGVSYNAVNGLHSSTYDWFIEGGNIVSGNGTDTIIVDWGGVGIGKIKVVEKSKWGCLGDTTTINVIKNHVLQGFKPVGKDSMCEFTSGIPYTVVKTNGSDYFWDAIGGTIAQDDTTNNVIIDWGKFGNVQVSVYEISYDSINNIPCKGAPVILDIVLHPIPTATSISGKFKVCEGDIGQLYSLNGFTGSKYFWKINNDTIGFNGQGNSPISLNITDTGKYTIQVVETSKYGCIGSPIDSVIRITPRPKTKPIIGDTIVCYPYFSPIQYKTKGLDSSVFHWQINSGTIDSGLTTNTIYTTFSGQQNNTIKVVEESNEGCFGDTLTHNVFADKPSLSINYISVGFPDNYMQLQWQLDNAPKYNSVFGIERIASTATDKSIWRKVATLSQTTFNYIDTNLNTDINPYQYRIRGTDLCNRNFYSDTHTNIFLNVIEPDKFEAKIDWTNYLGWKQGVANYEVYRRNDDQPLPLFNKGVGRDTTAGYDDGLNHFTQRYRIKAWENEVNPDTSWSNEVEIKFTPVLWVPNAFTPNDDGFNNSFVIVPGAIKTFEIEIFNRWGELLFSSTDTQKSWDGTFKGKPCEDGVYFYRLRYKGGDNVAQVQTGNITLIR